MTDIEFAKEVATKVWGWMELPYQPQPESDFGWAIVTGDFEKVDFVCSSSDLKNEVNSWAGFGRTVEAVAEMKIWEATAYNFAINLELNFRRFMGIELESISLNEFIKRVHQAALDAVTIK